MTTKMLSSLALASITTGISMCENFGEVAEAINHVIGYSLWTHELPGVAKDAKAAVLRQYPDMPAEEPEDWRLCAADVIERYGTKLPVEKGMLVRGLSPLASLRMLTDAEIIPVDPSAVGRDG